jgi:hypothetical protein
MKSATTIVIVAGVVLLVLSLAGHSMERDDEKITKPTPTPVRAVATTPGKVIRKPLTTPLIQKIKPPTDTYKDSVILLEAFMVECRLDTLYSLDVPQISQGTDPISAEHILKCLKSTDAAAVKAGAKLALAHENRAGTESTTRKALHIDPTNHQKTEYIDVGTSFTAIAEIRKDKVFAELELQYSDAVKADPKADAIPEIVERNWNSSICLNIGKPTLVGAIQDEDTGWFLIVTANIKQ